MARVSYPSFATLNPVLCRNMRGWMGKGSVVSRRARATILRTFAVIIGPFRSVTKTEPVMKVRENVSIDWQHKESARARIRVVVKRILRHRGYPPDPQESAIKLVLEQAEL